MDLIDTTVTVQPALQRAQQIAMIAAIVGVILSVVAFVVNPSVFFQSYLAVYLWVFGLSVAGLMYSMIHYLGGGRWGAAIGDVVRSEASQFWLLAILFIPIILGVPYLYRWFDPKVLAANPTLQDKVGWFSMPGWIGRAVIYFALLILISRLLDRWFNRWDATGDPVYRRRLRNLSGIGLAIVVLSVSFAMFDWIMSLEPGWASTIYGMMLIAGHGLAGWAFAIFVMTRLRHRWPISAYSQWRLWQDLGSLQLANLIIWAYTSFDQLMIIWIGNLNDEIPWYLKRMNDGWQYVGIFILAFQFAVPFFALVLRGTRRSPVALGRVTAMLFTARFVEDIFLTEPEFPLRSVLSHWTDLALLLALGGIWMIFFVRQLQTRLVVVRPAGVFPIPEYEQPLPPEPVLGAS